LQDPKQLACHRERRRIAAVLRGALRLKFSNAAAQ
jgi:hypothetical protein